MCYQEQPQVDTRSHEVYTIHSSELKITLHWFLTMGFRSMTANGFDCSLIEAVQAFGQVSMYRSDARQAINLGIGVHICEVLRCIFSQACIGAAR